MSVTDPMQPDQNQMPNPDGSPTAPAAPNVSSVPLNNPASPVAPAQPSQPQAPAQVPTSALQKPTQHDYFSGFLRHLKDVGSTGLKVASGGGQEVMRDPQTNQPLINPDGSVRTQAASPVSMGKSILAGALSAMAMSFQHMPSQDEGGRWHSNQNEAAQAGFASGQKSAMSTQVQEAQKQSDALRLRQYQTLEQNLKLRTLGLATHDQQGKSMQRAVDNAASTLEGIEKLPDMADSTGKMTPVVKGRHINEAAATQMIQDGTGHTLQDSGLPDGFEDMTDPVTHKAIPLDPNNPEDGNRQQLTYTVFNNAAVHSMSDKMRKDNPEMVNVPIGADVPIRTLVKYYIDKTVMGNAEESFSKWQLKDKDGKPVTAASFIAANPSLKSSMPLIGQYGNQSLEDTVLALDERKDIDKNLVGKLAIAGNVDIEQAKVTRKVEETRKLADAKVEGDKLPADKGWDTQLLADGRAYGLPDKQTNAIISDVPKNDATGAVKATRGDVITANKALREQQNVNNARSMTQAKNDENQIAKGQKPVIGFDQFNNQVFTSASGAKEYKLTQTREVGQGEAEKVTNARSLMPLLSSTDSDDLGVIQLAQKLDKEGKLGPMATRYQDWRNKVGSAVPFSNFVLGEGDTDVQRLLTKMGLATTALMQVHVGSRGGAFMLEHFDELASAKAMSGPAFLAALDTENKYVIRKAMLPKQQGAGGQDDKTQAAGKHGFN